MSVLLSQSLTLSLPFCHEHGGVTFFLMNSSNFYHMAENRIIHSDRRATHKCHLILPSHLCLGLPKEFFP